MFSKTIKAILVAAAIGVPAATVASAYPHTRYQAQIDLQINSVILGARAQGFNLLIANQRGQMHGVGSRVSFIVHLQAGGRYRFEGRCDTDCRDLDMVLRDANGYELIADRDYDDVPGFTVNAPYTGSYVVTLELAHCRAYRCQVGAVVLGSTV